MTVNRNYREFILTIVPEIDLYVTGSYGDLTLLLDKNSKLPINKEIRLAQLQRTGAGNENYGWVYLGLRPDTYDYQMYLQRNQWMYSYAFFGWYNNESTLNNSSPDPFIPAETASATLLGGDGSDSFPNYRNPMGDAHYILHFIPKRP